MNCFIASAFDKNDVDNIYDKIIVKVLKKHLINPLRVDRIEHNDDIDDKILELISLSDFGVVDLTYSRPSVYYEAGYLYGSGKPVIYIVRDDHFKAKDNDPFGNFRVHFDLQMKNIISWSTPTKIFKEKFEKRLIKVIKPLLIHRNQIVKTKDEENAFINSSQTKRQELIIENLIISLKRLKYKFPSSTPRIIRYKRGLFCHNGKNTICFFIEPTITKKMLEDLRFFLFYNPEELFLDKNDALHFVFVLFKSVPKNRISEIYTWLNMIENKVYNSKIVVKNRFIDQYIHIIDNVKSISDLNHRIANTIDKYLKSA